MKLRVYVNTEGNAGSLETWPLYVELLALCVENDELNVEL